ncbi:hypothetical protein KP509_21G056800 [Ceratopteris richardii]|uniref:Uncharacterized protein n=1 Tax=Ceratopteris richardii TaxID=49495 RepID=A0A8T2SDB7_CERRI|nr:hypothetical protein KP509_21G056800 [Ceratopteris richardii]KAH7315603.1 hypothetical protein KP509_21G056800 [Ceratopteris richardii]
MNHNVMRYELSIWCQKYVLAIFNCVSKRIVESARTFLRLFSRIEECRICLSRTVRLHSSRLAIETFMQSQESSCTLTFILEQCKFFAAVWSERWRDSRQFPDSPNHQKRIHIEMNVLLKDV